jgi:uncharacterized glyoxalase superfamily protein PhnB
MEPEYPAVIPMLAYENGVAAMDWLASAFGFKERARMLEADGRLGHGEMEAGDGLIMLATPSVHYQSPRHHREDCAPAARWQETPYIVDGVLVYVDDVDAHWTQARQAGARILTDPEDNPYGRSYRVEDLEGHRWMFMSAAPAP